MSYSYNIISHASKLTSWQNRDVARGCGNGHWARVQSDLMPRSCCLCICSSPCSSTLCGSLYKPYRSALVFCMHWCRHSIFVNVKEKVEGVSQSRHLLWIWSAHQGTCYLAGWSLGIMCLAWVVPSWTGTQDRSGPLPEQWDPVLTVGDPPKRTTGCKLEDWLGETKVRGGLRPKGSQMSFLGDLILRSDEEMSRPGSFFPPAGNRTSRLSRCRQAAYHQTHLLRCHFSFQSVHISYLN